MTKQFCDLCGLEALPCAEWSYKRAYGEPYKDGRMMPYGLKQGYLVTHVSFSCIGYISKPDLCVACRNHLVSQLPVELQAPVRD